VNNKRLESSRRKPNKEVFIYKKEMSTVVKLKQKDIVKLVGNVIKENEEMDERVLGLGQKQFKVYAAKDDKGNYYIIDAETGDVMAKDSSMASGGEELPMAAE
jgi:hypothetical protein